MLWDVHPNFKTEQEKGIIYVCEWDISLKNREMLDLVLGNGSWKNTNGWIKNKTNNSSLEVGRVRDCKVRTPSEAVIY